MVPLGAPPPPTRIFLLTSIMKVSIRATDCTIRVLQFQNNKIGGWTVREASMISE